MIGDYPHSEFILLRGAGETSGQSNSEIHIGLWGPRQAGKTTFLATLYHQCLEQDDWAIEPLDRESMEFIKEHHRLLYKQGEFPPPSQAAHPALYRFAITRFRRPLGLWGKKVSQTFTLQFPDVGGEWYEDIQRARGLFPADADPTKILAQCNGLLFLIDPQPRFSDESRGGKKEMSYFELLLEVIFEMRQLCGIPSGPLPKYLALVFTKMDLWYERRREGERFVREVLEKQAIKMLDTAFPSGRLRTFFSSSVGVVKSQGNRPNWEAYEDEHGNQQSRIVNPHELKPFEVFEPVEWLIDQLVSIG